MKRYRTWLLILILFALYPPLRSQEQNVRVRAVKQEFTETGFKAEGDVEVIMDDIRIYARYVEYNKATKVIFARGRVTMSSSDSVISGDRLTYNVEERSGDMVDVYGMMQPTIRYRTDQLEQTDAETYRFDALSFTSCAQLVPNWQVSARKGKIKKDKYIEMHGAVIRVKKIPIFYIPYLRYPIKENGRSTGFLFPKVGNSDFRGFYVQNSFYLALRPNLDMTLYLDYYSNAGIGVGEEFRYLTRTMNGYVNVYYFRYSRDSVYESDSSYDYYVTAEHVQKINLGKTSLVLRMNYPSNPDFLRLFNNNFDTVLSSRFDSSMNLTSKIAFFNLKATAARYETYFTIQNENAEEGYQGNSKVTEILPSISLTIKQKKIAGLPGYFSLSSEYESIRKTGPTLPDEPVYRTDFTSRRFNLTPSYMVDLVKSPWVSTTLVLESKNTFYPYRYEEETEEIVSEPLHVAYHSITSRFKGPVLYRISESKRYRTKHLIEPEIQVQFYTDLEDETRSQIVPVDKFDYPPYSSVSFSITSRWLSRSRHSDDSAREIATFSLSQQYYLDPEKASYGRSIEGVFPEFSDLTGSFRLRPTASFSMDIQGSYNHQLSRFHRASVVMTYDDKKSPVTGYLSYSYYNSVYTTTDYFYNRTILRGGLNVDIPGFPVGLNSSLDYDLTEKEMRSGSIKFLLDLQCITLIGEFRIFTFLGREETQFNVSVNFGNLGGTTGFFSGGVN